MSKSFWSRSVWNSLFNRVSGSRRLPKARRSRLPVQRREAVAIAESLEQRTVLAAVGVSFSAGTLTLIATPGDTNEVVTVKAGAAFTDVLVKGQTTTRILSATSMNISTIVFHAGGGTKDSLSVSGITTPGGLTINTTDLEKLQVNASTNVTVDSDTSSAAELKLVSSNIAGTLNLSHEGDIGQSGALFVSGTTTITALDGVTPKNINLKTSSNSFGTLALSGADVTVKEAGPTDLGSSTATGDLNVTSSGAISSTALTVGDDATFTSNGSTINVTGAFAGDIILKKGTNITVTDTNGDANLGKSTATGSLTVTSVNGDVNAGTNKITVGGLATFTAHGGGVNDGDIFLTGSNNFGSLSLNGDNATVNEKSSTNLFTSTLAGDLMLTSAGAITDSGKLDIGGDTTLTTKGAAITLDRTDSVFGGSLILTGTDISVRDNDADTTLGNVTAKGNFDLRSTGDVTQSGSLTVSGRMTVTAKNGGGIDQDITLTGASNRLGSVSLFGAEVQLTEADSTNLFTTTVTGALTVISSGPITDSGAITVSGTATFTATGKSVTLDNVDSAYNGRINLTASNGFILNTVDTELGNITTTSNFTLHSAGDVTQAANTTISIAGRITIDDNGNDIDISLGTATGTTANFGSISMTTLGDVSIMEDSSSDLFDSEIGGDFTLVSAGAVTDSGDLQIGGDTVITAMGANITLNSQGSTFAGKIRLSGANVYLYNDHPDGTDIDTTTATGTLTIVSAGAISDSGVITVSGKATFDAQGDDITLNEAGIDFNGPLALFGGNVTVTTGAATGDLDLATSTISGNLMLTVDGNISDSGTIRVDGVATISVSAPATQNIVLNSALNQFDSLILSAKDITINEFGDTVLNSVTATGNFTLTSSGGITDTGTLSITGAASFTASGGDLTLDTATSTFGSLELIGNNIVVKETGDTVLALVSTNLPNGTFDLTSTGNVTQTGNITVGGKATLTVTGNITLTQDGDAMLANDTIKNNFGSLVFSGTNVAIHESSPTVISPSLTDTSSASGTLTLKSLGSITATGKVTAGSTTDLQAGDSGMEVITLNKSDNEFGELRLKGGVVTITDSTGGTTLGLGSVGSLNLTTAGGNVTRTGDSLTVAAQLAINAGANSVDLRTGSGTNNFGSISITANNLTMTEASGTVIDFLDLAGDLDLISGGDVTGHTANIEIDGTTTISTPGDINIDPTFGGAVNLTADDIVLIADGNLTLGNITATGNVTITAVTGNVANLTTPTTGKLDIDGVLTINAGANAVTINIAMSESNLSNPLVVNTTGIITTTIPTASITTINGVTGPDNNVNSTESMDTIGIFTITGSVSGNLKDGDVVTLIVNSVTYLGVVDGGGTTFTVNNVKGQDLAAGANHKIDASVTTSPRFGAYDVTAVATKTYTANPGGA